MHFRRHSVLSTLHVRWRTGSRCYNTQLASQHCSVAFTVTVHGSKVPNTVANLLYRSVVRATAVNPVTIIAPDSSWLNRCIIVRPGSGFVIPEHFNIVMRFGALCTWCILATQIPWS